MKKLLSILALLLVFALTLTACKQNSHTTHSYLEDYKFDDDYHWFVCSGCDEINNKEAHTFDNNGVCTTCKMPMPATDGVVYKVSYDNTYDATVTGYKGTATKVKIAEEYKFLPVTAIGKRAFYNCYKLTSITIPNSVTSIGDDAFQNCSSLTSVVIPDSVTSIGAGAFQNCFSLTSVVIPDSVTSIGAGAFQYCQAITSIVIPDSVTSISAGAFQYCQAITSIVIFDGVTSIGAGAFKYCQAITSIVIPDSVTSIGDSAFRNCYSLTSVVIGDSATNIGYGAFSGCYALTDVYYTGTEEEWAQINIGGSNDYLTNATIHYNYVPEEN